MTMQIYKKEFKPYLVLSICLALLFAVTGNFWAHLPGDSFYEQVNFFFAESMLDLSLIHI